MSTRTRNPEIKLKVITLPSHVLLHYQEKATAEVQSLSALLRAIIMRDYNGRIAGNIPAEPPVIIKANGGIDHQIGLPTAVHDFYKHMAKTNGVGLMAILRTIIVNDYLSSGGGTEKE